MRHLFILLLFSISTSTFAQIGENRYTETEIAYQDKFLEAKKYMLIERYDKAEPLLKEIYKEDRTDPAVSLELAKLYHAKELPFDEYKYAKSALDHGDNNEFIVKYFAQLCNDQGKYGEAIDAYKELVKGNPRNEEYTDKLATTYLQINESDKALAAYEAIEKLIGLQPEITGRKLEIYEILGQEKKAEKALVALSDAYPNNLDYKHNLATFYIRMGNRKDAVAVYQEIIQIDEFDAKANLELAKVSSPEQGENNYLRSLIPIIENKSIGIDKKVLELVPYTEKLAGKYNEELAKSLLELTDKLAIIHPKSAKSYALKGDVLLLSERYSDAVKSYEKTLQLDDTVFPVWEQLLYAYNELESYKKLENKALEAIDFFPNEPKAYYFYGIGAAQNGNLKDAIDYLDEAVLISGKDMVAKSNILAELGIAYAMDKQYDKAKKSVAKSLEVSQGKNPLSTEAMGDVLFLEGKKGDARKQWKEALKMMPTSKKLQDKIASGTL